MILTNPDPRRCRTTLALNTAKWRAKTPLQNLPRIPAKVGNSCAVTAVAPARSGGSHESHVFIIVLIDIDTIQKLEYFSDAHIRSKSVTKHSDIKR